MLIYGVIYIYVDEVTVVLSYAFTPFLERMHAVLFVLRKRKEHLRKMFFFGQKLGGYS